VTLHAGRTAARTGGSRRPSLLWRLLTLLAGLGLCVAGAPAHADSGQPAPEKHAAPPAVDGDLRDWTGVAPGAAGQSATSAGEFIYQDYLYDDAGAKTGSGGDNRDFRGSAAPQGSYKYPNDRTGCATNCADLFQFRAALDGDRVTMLVRLNTLLREESTVAAIAIGTHGSTAAAPHPWPLGANFATRGTEHVITVWGTGGAFDETDLSAVAARLA
jgi:hypothetical protein